MKERVMTCSMLLFQLFYISCRRRQMMKKYNWKKIPLFQHTQEDTTTSTTTRSKGEVEVQGRMGDKKFFII